ncbi:hypothetical protein BJX61DRAFT_514855 [Aspergillus egyptiacus]|nr:hypothetical protein BJX61DRAFT_514855 [Aspergillus egyptiacus]
MSSLSGSGSTPSGNQPTTSTRGGASAQPTPANNSGGGAGWGDSGFIKGGIQGISSNLPGSSDSGSKLATLNGEFPSMKEQKGAAEEKYLSRFAEAGGPLPSTAEDASFMNHKPGGGDTLPGWNKLRGMMGQND